MAGPRPSRIEAPCRKRKKEISYNKRTLKRVGSSVGITTLYLGGGRHYRRLELETRRALLMRRAARRLLSSTEKELET
jgi:hypothetical protein